MKLKSWQVAVEVKTATVLLVGLGLAYLVLGIVIVTTSEASPRTLLLPVASVIFGGLVAGGLALRMPSSRFFGFAVAALFGLLHAFLLLAGAVLWFKLFSAVLAVGYIYTWVLLNSGPMRRYLLGDAA
ncbi:hypothetical protein LWP59_30445 [Amycolatopsis acidiphila]|uniref:DUF4233 domain-containing protein n=1 Tax=Amycolatopsis acidiphila TaxID=715473 RepID=A0A557ZR46_9PSEU|nr:hypothetical protein [Amycolatopsis acidiphila]TVT14504.1 hypothetical protein FNH06_37655 [Amycolatopsis acidiphila]UIJ58403.1 hypothetical protein LWP59_30445 [Amycolatopsis acidiphila]GHG93478.1 hypothetical protein GCM10017788_70880 [Amycolatopsis acidiphila]